MKTAIVSDAELYVAREDARAAADGVTLAESVFGARLFGELSATREDQPPTATSFRAEDSIIAGSLGITGRLGTGLTYTLSTGLQRHEHDDPFSSVYRPATTATVRAELVQPLWRGAFGAARKPVVVASLRQNRSEHELRARIERTVAAVQIAYWNLVRARAEQEARKSALDLAKEQVGESKRLVRLGSGADLDVVEAETGVGRRTLELLRSDQDVVEAEGRLYEAIGIRIGEAGWDARKAIVPSDAADLESRTIDLDRELAFARNRRGDALAARSAIAAETAALEITSNQRRPALDVVVAAGTVGFAGTLVSSYATAGVNGPGLDPPYMTDPAYDGSTRTALENTLGRDLQLVLGLRFEIPFGDHEAEVRHTIQSRVVARTRLVERETLAKIESEVRTAAARVAVDTKLVAAADQAVTLAAKLLDGTRKRFRAGAGTTFDVLRVSEELTRARVEAARARADYRVSLTRLAAATGTLLDPYNITLKSLGSSPK